MASRVGQSPDPPEIKILPNSQTKLLNDRNTTQGSSALSAVWRDVSRPEMALWHLLNALHTSFLAFLMSVFLFVFRWTKNNFLFSLSFSSLRASMSPLSSGPSRVPCKLFVLWYHWELLLVFVAWGKWNAACLRSTFTQTHTHTSALGLLWTVLSLHFAKSAVPVGWGVGVFYFQETFLESGCVFMCVYEAQRVCLSPLLWYDSSVSPASTSRFSVLHHPMCTL